jgi:hypothetical protein
MWAEYNGTTEAVSFVAATPTKRCEAENAATFLMDNLPTYQTAPDMTMTMAG